MVAPGTLDVVTWNLNGLDDLNIDLRCEAAIFLVIADATLHDIERGAKPKRPPDVVLLQEVVTRTFRAHVRPHLVGAGYTVFPLESPERQTFEVLAVRSSWTVQDFRSEPLDRSLYGRMMHTLEATGPLGPVQLHTSHFDSGPEAPASAVRDAQARHLRADFSDRSIFGGDTNLRVKEWDAMKDRMPWTDAWEAVGSPTDLRDTWTDGHRKARFDRVWYGPSWQCVALRSVGAKPLRGLNERPSDHIGLRATFVPAP